jgi:hypothetical protein
MHRMLPAHSACNRNVSNMQISNIIHDFGVVLTKLAYGLLWAGGSVHLWGTRIRLFGRTPRIVGLEQDLFLDYTAHDAHGRVYCVKDGEL